MALHFQSNVEGVNFWFASSSELLLLPGSTQYGYWKSLEYPKEPSGRKYALFWIFMDFNPFVIVPSMYNYWLFEVY